MALLGAFGSPALIATLEPSELIRVPGIGLGLAEKILEGLRRAMEGASASAEHAEISPSPGAPAVSWEEERKEEEGP